MTNVGGVTNVGGAETLDAEEDLEDKADAIEDNADAIEDNVQDLPLEDDGDTGSAAPKESVIAAAVGMALVGAAVL